MSATNQESSAKVGVGLRHPHYGEALSSAADLDFVEVHTENFFVEGGGKPRRIGAGA